MEGLDITFIPSSFTLHPSLPQPQAVAEGQAGKGKEG